MFKLYFLIGLSIDSVNGRHPEMMKKDHLSNEGDSQERDSSCDLLYAAKCNCMPLTTISFVWFYLASHTKKKEPGVQFDFCGRMKMNTANWIIQETGGWLESGYNCSIKVLSRIQKRNSPSGRL